MPPLTDIRTSLEVGFPEGGFPKAFVGYRGRDTRSIAALPEFPYEDAQFNVVLMDGAAVAPRAIKEAHRVLRPEGYLFFIVPEKTGKQAGFTLPDIYKTVRYGFDIVDVERPPWWLFGCRGRTLTICARKKNWKALTNTYRPYL